MRMKQRMYILVARSLSPIQKGIQALHAVVEYENLYGDSEEYQRWAKHDKTVILLDGGTSSSKIISQTPLTFHGMLDNAMQVLREQEISVAGFKEEDVNNALTAVAVLADERIWDRVAYPDFIPSELPTASDYYREWVETIGGERQEFLRKFLGGMRLAN
jgi:hypothetical protein